MTRCWTNFQYFLVACAVLSAYSVHSRAQAPLANLDETPEHRTPERWDKPVNYDATSNLIFQSLAGLMQMAPNSKYPNGASH